MAPELKIAFLHPDLGIGGAERLIVDAAVSLKKLGHNVQMFTTHHSSSHCFPETKDGYLPVVVIGDWLPRSLFGRLRALCAYVRMVWMSLIVSAFYSSSFQLIFVDQISVAMPVVRCFTKAKIVFYCHFPDMLLTTRRSLIKSLYRIPIDFVEDWSMSKADYVFFNSHFTQEVSRRVFKHLRPSVPVGVLYPCISESLLNRQAENVSLEDCGIPSGKRIIFMSLNRFERKKNISVALYAFALLRQSLDNDLQDSVHLVIAGGYDPELAENAEHFQELEQLSSSLMLNESVTFVRSPSEDTKLALLSNCTALLYTPVEEHFGIVPLEAMCCKVPVIACRSGGPLETILDNETGFLVEPEPAAFASAMRKFVDDQSLHDKLGEAGRLWTLQKFSSDQFTAGMASICDYFFPRPNGSNISGKRFWLKMLNGKVALVTGASRGIGRGIALQLAQAGATVYITGIPADDCLISYVQARGGKCFAIYCDHSRDEDIRALFDQISENEEGRLDILVNNAFSGVSSIMDCIKKKFWECEPQFWDEINNVGLRGHYVCAVYAARMMVKNKSGLIVNISSYGGLFYLFNPAYGIGKCACDRMAADCALELKNENVAFLSLWPGFVSTETMMHNIDNLIVNSSVFGLEEEAMKDLISNAESVEFAGKCVVHLASDKNIMKKTGRVLFTADVAREYGFTDVNNKPVESVRSVKLLLAKKNHHTLSALVPSWVRIPGWLMVASNSKL
ncbi:adh short and Glycos transf 1 and Glyco trans 4 4 domain containing protein [Trichuris trichiura]|uniref:Alpha-1,3/1,6-mannosyltransferase ALG2 n=1 Tax=Trichuris trichiura TaxID=36087 RepID=A0A077Z6T2_TRITR|nr:adh short and Glycos transf 1 and Glyco trans 4 4 domain containing protein [Trichuris trichiura]